MFMIVLYLWLFYEIMIDLTWGSEKKWIWDKIEWRVRFTSL